MKKVAIVGVEGSGKTVMLAGLGELYARPDENGFFLEPKNRETASYVSSKIARMRRGIWPLATPDDVMQGLNWVLRRQTDPDRRPQDFCEVSFLDFPGEVYRAAFGDKEGFPRREIAASVESLKGYVKRADVLMVLVNLRDVITNSYGDGRVQESTWITKSILDTALGEGGKKAATRAVIVLSQADSYAETIRLYGGPKGVLDKYLPNVASCYGFLDVIAVSVVSKTVLDAQGNVVPSSDFQLDGLKALVKWIVPAYPDLVRDVTRFLALGSLGVGALLLGLRFANQHDMSHFGVSVADCLWSFLMLLGTVGIFMSYWTLFSWRKVVRKMVGYVLIGVAIYSGAAIYSKKVLELVKRDPQKSYERGCQYWKDKDYKEAVKWYRRSADKGNVAAQYALGRMYENGMGVAQNYEEAVMWYRRSAERGKAAAQYALGRMYENGMGVAQNYEESAKWYRKAEQQSHHDAKEARIRLEVSQFLFQKAREYAWDDFYIPSTEDFHDELGSLKSVAWEELESEILTDKVIALLDCYGWGSGVVFSWDGMYILKAVMPGEGCRFVSWSEFAQKGKVTKPDSSVVQICEPPFIGIKTSGCDLLKSDKAVPLFEGLLKIARGEE